MTAATLASRFSRADCAPRRSLIRWCGSRPNPAIRCRPIGRPLGAGLTSCKVFIGTLGWSRTAYVAFCDDEQFETLRSAHEHAFDFFAGVPREVLYDNMKTVVLERSAYRRNLHRFHRKRSISR